MNVKDKVAFSIYLLLGLTCVVVGLLDLSIPTIMPYHFEILKVGWVDLDSGVRMLLRTFFIMSAAGFLLTGASVLILLFIPFRRGDRWVRFALPVPLFTWNIFLLVLGLRTALRTGVSTPWPAAAAAMVLLLTAVLLTVIPGRDNKF